MSRSILCNVLGIARWGQMNTNESVDFQSIEINGTRYMEYTSSGIQNILWDVESQSRYPTDQEFDNLTDECR